MADSRSSRDTKVAPLQRNAAQLDSLSGARKRKLNDQKQPRPSGGSLGTSPAATASNNATSMAVAAPLTGSTGGVAREGSRRVARPGGGTTRVANDSTNPPHGRQPAGASAGHRAFTGAQANSAHANSHRNNVALQPVAGRGRGEGTSRSSNEKEESYIHPDFTMVIHINGKWHELKCHFCKANMPGNKPDFFQRVSGLLGHVASTNDHPKVDDRKQFLLDCIQGTFNEADVAKMEAGQWPTSRVISKTRGNAAGGSTQASSLGFSVPSALTSAMHVGHILEDDVLPDPASEQHATETPTTHVNFQKLLDGLPPKQVLEAPSDTAGLAEGRQKESRRDSQNEDKKDPSAASHVRCQHDVVSDSIVGAQPNALQTRIGHPAPPVTARRANRKQKEVLQERYRGEEMSVPIESTVQGQRGMAELPSQQAVDVVLRNVDILHRSLPNTVRLSGKWCLIRCKTCLASAERESGTGELVIFQGIFDLKQHVERFHQPSAQYEDLSRWCDFEQLKKETVRAVHKQKLNPRKLPFDKNRSFAGHAVTRTGSGGS